MDEKSFREYLEDIKKVVRTDFERIGRQIEKEDSVPPEFWKICKKKGLLKTTSPIKYGGLGMTAYQWFQVLEHIGQCHGTIRMILHTWNGLSIRIMEKYGSEAQKEKWFPKLVSGEWWPEFALTEPDTGSGADITTMAVKQGDNWVINGKKHLVSYPKLTQAMYTLAVTDPTRRKSGGLTAFLVHKGNPGYIIEPMPGGMGMRGSDHGVLHFKDCVVPSEDVVGEIGQGLDIFLDALDLSRASIAVACLGLSQRSLEMAVQYSKERVTFGKKISQRQAIQQMLADMATAIHALRLMVLDCAKKFDQGLYIRRESSMCKLFGIDTVRMVTDKALEILGGRGFFKTSDFERIYRDARAGWLEEGTPTILRTVISREVINAGA